MEAQYYRGCLLGLAVGDAMGYTVEDKSWDEIQTEYGPGGLLGYDLKEDEYAPVTSHTQIAAFLCNGLLLALTRGRKEYMRWSKLALKEWTRSQQFYRDPEKSYCFLCKLPQFHRRHCRDARMMDNHRLEFYGSMTQRKNMNNTPGAITAGIAAGMLYKPGRITPEGVGELAGELIALTHGHPETFLSGVVLSYIIAGVLHDPDHSLSQHFTQAIQVVEAQYGNQFPQMERLSMKLRRALDLARNDAISPLQAMELIGSEDTAECLAGAMYACLASPKDFDGAIITAVNHSGTSAAVGAIAGAVMGARLGEDALPEFYLESVECTDVLRTLAQDMAAGTPALGIFDDSWDHKYEQGLPPENG